MPWVCPHSPWRRLGPSRGTLSTRVPIPQKRGWWWYKFKEDGASPNETCFNEKFVNHAQMIQPFALMCENTFMCFVCFGQIV
jgi:hypothetical protein